MVLSKFDLKVRFWQLGIQPEVRPKTTFTLLGYHYQSTIMPFGLKTAPSLFQKAMTIIFGLIQDNALIYIDDILLFSCTKKEHVNLLIQFHNLVKNYGVLL